jgi:hypothetical protein
MGFLSALSGLVFAFSPPPSFKEGLGVVAFDFHHSKKTKQSLKLKPYHPPAPPKMRRGAKSLYPSVILVVIE